MSILEIQTAKVFEPLLYPSRYKGAKGGRGSAKSHFFAEALIEKCLMQKTDAVCIREVQKTLSQSAKKLIEQKIIDLKVGHLFEVQSSIIKAPYGGQIIFQGMQDHTADSIKSLEGFDIAWCEEAQSLSQRSLDLLRPTIRKEGSEIWFSWNPTNKNDAVEALFSPDKMPTGAVLVTSNWRDNPWFPDVLEQERLDCLRDYPDKYDHIWEGGYMTFVDGAYYAKQLATARLESRIGDVRQDPLMSIYAMFDIGGTGHKSDATAIWIMQQIGLSIRVLDYYEARGQELAEHVFWLRNSGYERAEIVLPHDGDNMDKVHRVSFKTEFEAAGFKVHILKNQGAGAAMKRIEAVRRAFNNIWIDKTKCSAGLDALGAYAPKFDEERGVDLGVNHNWASHGSDAFGTGIVWLAQRPALVKTTNQSPKLRSIGIRRYR